MIDFVGYMRTELSNAKVDARALILGTKQPRYIAPSEAERQRKVLDLLQQFYNLWNNSVLMPPIPDIEAYADRLAYLLGAAPWTYFLCWVNSVVKVFEYKRTLMDISLGATFLRNPLSWSRCKREKWIQMRVLIAPQPNLRIKIVS